MCSTGLGHEVKATLAVLMFAVACTQAAPRSGRSERPEPTAGRPLPAQQQWYPMADAAVPLPGTCSAQCSLDCDLWAGQISCAGEVGPIAVWGGLSSMAGMQLDERGGRLQGTEPLAEGAQLRWGISANGEFCGVVRGP